MTGKRQDARGFSIKQCHWTPLGEGEGGGDPSSLVPFKCPGLSTSHYHSLSQAKLIIHYWVRVRMAAVPPKSHPPHLGLLCSLCLESPSPPVTLQMSMCWRPTQTSQGPWNSKTALRNEQSHHLPGQHSHRQPHAGNRRRWMYERRIERLTVYKWHQDRSWVNKCARLS